MIEVADQALLLLKNSSDPYSDIKRSSCYWIPLQWLYVRMIENKDLVRLSELDKREKVKYWSLVKNLKKDKAVKIMMAQAIYTWDNLKNG
jgi:hypothetical protein